MTIRPGELELRGRQSYTLGASLVIGNRRLRLRLIELYRVRRAGMLNVCTLKILQLQLNPKLETSRPRLIDTTIKSTSGRARVIGLWLLSATQEN